MRYLILLSMILMLAVACAKENETPEAAPPPELPKVRVLELTPRTWQQTIRTFGVIEAAEKVTLSAEFSGKVTGVFFDEGQEIAAGDKLVTFDVTERRMQVKQAEGNLAGVTARLEEARTQAERREELFQQKVVSKEQLESARAALASLQAQYEQLVVGRSLARHQLSRARLMSPVSGRVATKAIDVGEVAMPGQTLAVIHVTDTMRVVTYVTEQEVNTVQVGTPCIVTTPGVRGREYTAHVESVGNAADPATGNFPVKLAVKNTEGLLKAGMTAVVTLKGLALKDTLLVPDDAVVDRHRQRVVFLEKAGKAHAVAPVLAASTGEWLPVLHGLAKGDRLIVEGLDNVVDGTAVNVAGQDEMPVLNGADGGPPNETIDDKKAAKGASEQAAQPDPDKAEGGD